MDEMAWVWIGVIVVSVFVEWMTQLQLITIWSAIGGIVALILDLCHVDIVVQFIVFFAVTIVLLLLTRPLAKRMIKKVGVTPTNADMNIGRKGKVTKIIDENMKVFRVRVDNCDWSAVTENNTLLPVGTEISVLRIEGVKLIVEPVRQTAETTAN